MKTSIFKICAFILLLALMGAGCEKKDSIPVCGIQNPLTAIKWLHDLKIAVEENPNINSAEIILYRFNDVDYIYVQESTVSSHDFPNTIYDCDGNEKYTCGGNQSVNNCSTFFNEAQKIETLWKKE